MSHVADNFYAAVRTLAGDGPAKQRLINAYVNHLESLAITDVPMSIQSRFEALREAMEAVPPTERETSVQVSVRKMAPADAGLLARSIIAMFAEQVRVKETGDRLGAGNRKPEVHAPKFDIARPVRVPTFLAG